MFIARLRRKLGAASIETVRGLGYRMACEGPPPMSTLRAQVLLGAAALDGGPDGPVGDRSLRSTRTRSASSTVVHGHPHGLMLGAALCMVAGYVVVRTGLSPFAEMRRRLADVQSGRDAAAAGTYPARSRSRSSPT